MLVRMFVAQIPTYLQTGFSSFAVLVLIIKLSDELQIAYPNKDALQAVIDENSAVILRMDEIYQKSIANGKDEYLTIPLNND